MAIAGVDTVIKLGLIYILSALWGNAVMAEIPLYNEDGLFKPGMAANANKPAEKRYLNPVVGQPAWDYWGLTEAEWKQYEELKKNSNWSVWEHTASPLALLSHYAQESDRQRYARIEAELDEWRFNKSMDFQRVYNREREIVHANYVKGWEKRAALLKNLSSVDRTLFFVPAGECNARCTALINPLMNAGVHIDVYVVGATTEAEVFFWAKSAAIPPERTQIKQITLNFETGVLQQISSLPMGLVDLPVA
jgi:integrating conjugative element protein (TIGR03759 family)